MVKMPRICQGTHTHAEAHGRPSLRFPVQRFARKAGEVQHAARVERGAVLGELANRDTLRAASNGLLKAAVRQRRTDL